MRTKDREIQEIAKRQCGVIAWPQLEQLGVTRSQIGRRVRSGEWIHELSGVWRLSWAEPSWLQKAWCASLWAGMEAFLSHRTAARLWGLDGVRFDDVEVSAPRQLWVSVPWLLAHETAPISKSMQRTRGGLAVTSPARTLIDLSAVVDESTLQRAIEDAFRRRIAAPSELRRALRYLPLRGKAGTGRLGRVLGRGLWSVDTQSELERRAFELFRHHGLPQPQCQYMVIEDERSLGTVDFAWPDARVIVEAEGFQFHTGREAWDNDATRYNTLSLHGWTVLRLTETDLRKRAAAFARALGKLVGKRHRASRNCRSFRAAEGNESDSLARGEA